MAKSTLAMQLEDAFYTFAGFGTRQMVHDMDGPRFAKMMKDANLVDRWFSATDCDIVFAKVKAKGTRRINFIQFLETMDQIADRKNVSVDYVINSILAAFPTTNNATRADFVRYHDDRNTYTGVYAKGSPTTVDKFKATPGGVMSALCDRAPANIRGVKYSYPTVR